MSNICRNNLLKLHTKSLLRKRKPLLRRLQVCQATNVYSIFVNYSIVSTEGPKPIKRGPSIKVEVQSSLQLRHSTKEKTLEREKAHKEASRVARPRAPHRVLPQREFTQKDLLFESLDTEVQFYLLMICGNTCSIMYIINCYLWRLGFKCQVAVVTKNG